MVNNVNAYLIMLLILSKILNKINLFEKLPLSNVKISKNKIGFLFLIQYKIKYLVVDKIF